MSLPTISVPTYSMSIPSDGKNVNFRPFLVKEEKVLHMAMEAGDTDSKINSVVESVASCLEGYDKDTVRAMPVFDIEYCFLQIRSKSIGEMVKPSMVCSECKNKFEVPVDLSEIEIVKKEDHDTNIPLSDGVGVVMKYPSLEDVGPNLQRSDDESQLAMNILVDCIDSVYDDKTVYSRKDFTDEELRGFVDELTKENFDKLSNFFETMPKLEKTVEYKCPACGHKDSIDIEGIENFFG